MREFLFDNLDHSLCALILLSRVGDVVTTYLITPTLVLEANPFVRRLGWKFAAASLAVCLVPYYSVDAAIMILVPFLLVSASNAGKIWFVRAMGEQQYKKLQLTVASESKLWMALAAVAVSAFFVVLTGAVLLFFYPYPEEDWGFWFALGLILYGLVIALYGSLYLCKLFKEARTQTLEVMDRAT